LPIQVPGQAIQEPVEAIQVSEEPIQICNLHLLLTLLQLPSPDKGLVIMVIPDINLFFNTIHRRVLYILLPFCKWNEKLIQQVSNL
jgi:hypothetical protein